VGTVHSDMDYLLEKIPKSRAKKMEARKKMRQKKRTIKLIIFTTILCIVLDLFFYYVLEMENPKGENRVSLIHTFVLTNALIFVILAIYLNYEI